MLMCQEVLPALVPKNAAYVLFQATLINGELILSCAVLPSILSCLVSPNQHTFCDNHLTPYDTICYSTFGSMQSTQPAREFVLVGQTYIQTNILYLGEIATFLVASRKANTATRSTEQIMTAHPVPLGHLQFTCSCAKQIGNSSSRGTMLQQSYAVQDCYNCKLKAVITSPFLKPHGSNVFDSVKNHDRMTP